MGYVATLPTCGPPLILPPALKGPSCVNRRFVLGCANSGRPTLLLLLLIVDSVVASAVVAAAAVDTHPGVPTVVATSAVNTRRGVWICRKWYAVPPQYPDIPKMPMVN